ncbi:MAG: hypothetical protein ACRERY_02195 [Pseudomonas sp.]
MFLRDSYVVDRQGLEDQIFPGEQWAPELKAALRELLEQIGQAGRDINIHNLGLFLGDFMPRHTLDRAEEWQERAMRRWFTQTKPALVARLVDWLSQRGLAADDRRSGAGRGGLRNALAEYMFMKTQRVFF